MAKKKKCPECPTCPPAWLVQFGDLMSLLLTFFVLLLSMSSLDAKKVEAAIGSLAGAMSILEGGVKTEVNQELAQRAATGDMGSEVAEKTSSMVTDFNEMIEAQGGSAITMEEAQEGFTINLPSSILFEAGSAEVTNEDAVLFLKRLALMMDSMPNDIELNVRGHTDNEPPAASSVYQNNWELSSARALSVTQILIDNQVREKKITVAGNAGFRPVATNATLEGRAKNRRVELQFYAREQDAEQRAQKSVLELEEEGQ